ncbi:NAD(P)/FAD-dependent oxidoreductase [bacterium]|nr:NAD(P)/FAD-dependent oxidoreductase [bacterium]
MKIYDTIIIGGGPAGLSAAKHLAYFKRDVLVIDRKTSPMYYNHNPIHNYLGAGQRLTGIRMQRQFQAETVSAGAEFRVGNVTHVSGKNGDFTVTIQSVNRQANSENYRTRTLLLTTGVAIIHPKINHDWGEWLLIASIAGACFYCRDCEAPLVQGKSVIVISVGSVNSAIDYARTLRQFAKNVRILIASDGFVPPQPEWRTRLDESGFEYDISSIRQANVVAPGRHQKIILENGKNLTANCFFVSTIRQPRSELARQLGLQLTDRNGVQTDISGKTSVPGVWAAGDVTPVARQIAVAVGSGNYAALMINRALDDMNA